MTIYQRYFRVTTGPLVEAACALEAEDKKSREVVLNFVKEIGAINMYSRSGGAITGFQFEKTPDQYIWKQPNSFGHYLPRKNTAGGKEMAQRIASLPIIQGFDPALRTVDLTEDNPVIFGDGKCYFATITGSALLKVFFVSVPWRDIDPEKLQQYKQERAADKHYSVELDHLCWTPSQDMHEIKRWELEKEIEELNAKLRQISEEKKGAAA